ncbi:MAG: hypothetical protein WD768_12560 [Phycisphaeraceae bacterium]
MARRYGAQRGNAEYESGYRPKKSSSGLWIGIGISGAILILIVVILLVTLGGNIGRTTHYSRDFVLKKHDISSFNRDPANKDAEPARLSPVAEAGSGDASSQFEALLRYYQDNRAAIDPDGTSAEVGEAILDHFISLQQAGAVPARSFDGVTPMLPQAKPDFDAALLNMALAGMKRAAVLHARPNDESKQRAMDAAKALWVLGLTMYEKSKRVPLRTMGMELMRAAGTEIFNWSGDGTELGDAITKWVNAMNKFDEEYWGPKSAVIGTLRYGEPDSPTLGDLVNIAQNDEDPTWRVAATLELGRAKYSRRTSQQDRALQGVISSLQSDKDPAVAEAARVAEKYTKSNVRGLGS